MLRFNIDATAEGAEEAADMTITTTKITNKLRDDESRTELRRCNDP